MIDQVQLAELRKAPPYARVAVTRDILESMQKLLDVAQASEILSSELYLLRQASSPAAAYAILQSASFQDGVAHLLIQLAALN